MKTKYKYILGVAMSPVRAKIAFVAAVTCLGMGFLGNIDWLSWIDWGMALFNLSAFIAANHSTICVKFARVESCRRY